MCNDIITFFLKSTSHLDLDYTYRYMFAKLLKLSLSFVIITKTDIHTEHAIRNKYRGIPQSLLVCTFAYTQLVSPHFIDTGLSRNELYSCFYVCWEVIWKTIKSTLYITRLHFFQGCFCFEIYEYYGFSCLVNLLKKASSLTRLASRLEL